MPVDVERPVNLTAPRDVEGPVNLSAPLDVRGPIIVQEPVVLARAGASVKAGVTLVHVLYRGCFRPAQTK